MSKRLTVVLLMLLGAVLLLAHTTLSQVKLHATKIELNGTVKLTWTKPLTGNNTTQYSVYRALLPDSTVFSKITVTMDTSFVDVVPPVLSPVPQVFAYKVVATTGLVNEQSNIVFASVPGIPPFGGFRLEGKIDNGKAKLVWQQPAVGNVNHYIVYRGILGDNAPSHISIDSTTNLFSITDAPIVFNPNSPVTFVFYVKAVLTSGDVIVSTILQLTIHSNLNYDYVKFTSNPNPNGQKDVKYQYTAHAVSSDPTAVIQYSGSAYNQMGWTVMENFVVDPISGVVDWTPLLKGAFKVMISARSNKGGTGKQEFFVFVSGGNGIIQGKVTDTVAFPNTMPIPNAIIEVFKTENNNSLSFAYSARTDNNGNYRINRVDPGIYKIKANAPSGKFQSQWYDGQREVSQANPVTVEDSSKTGPTIVSFKLRGGSMNAPKINMSGIVTDSSGIAINGADCRVIFVRAEFALNLSGGMGIGMENIRKYFDFNHRGDFRLEGNSEFVFKAKVDSIGRYMVKVPPGAYIAFARAKGYAVEFYNSQANILSADVIHVHHDTTGINFTLFPLPPIVLGSITGSVSDSVRDIFVPARVIAFRDGWRFNDMHRIGRVYVTDTDSTGSFVFNDVLPGMYVIMAIPLGNYAPAFYSADTVNYRWKHATKVEVANNGNSVDNINIYVKPLGPSANGFTGITGTITIGNGNNMMNGTARAGAIVYAQRDGEIVGYSFTNAEGKYAITGLAPGQYSVFVDKAGFHESSTSVVSASYDGSGNPLSATADFSISSVLSVSANTALPPTEYTLKQNYPNPFNPSTTISYSLPKSDRTTLKIYDILGKEVATLVNGFQQAGPYTVSFSAQQLSSGVYFYRLESGSFSIVKKMMFIK